MNVFERCLKSAIPDIMETLGVNYSQAEEIYRVVNDDEMDLDVSSGEVHRYLAQLRVIGEIMGVSEVSFLVEDGCYLGDYVDRGELPTVFWGLESGFSLTTPSEVVEEFKANR